MSLLDFLPFILIIGYAVLGFFTGLVHRFIGFIAMFLAFIAATAMGVQAGGILQQTSNFVTPDARIYGFFGIVVAVLIVVDGAAWLARSQIKVEAIVFNRAAGVAVGVLTAVILTVLLTHEFEAAAKPFGGPALDPVEQSIRDTVTHSKFTVPLVDHVGGPILVVFQPLLPADPQIYFSSNPVS